MYVVAYHYLRRARYRTYDLVAYDKCEVSYTCLTVKERLSSRD